jgi:chaperonin cofactor prefoldin
VLNKQESRLKENIKELQTKIDEMIKARTQGSASDSSKGS